MTYNATNPETGKVEMHVRWSEEEAKCLEEALTETAYALGHAASVCAHVSDLISNAAPAPVPLAASSILYLTSVALNAMTLREAEVLHAAETRIGHWRRAAEGERWEAERLAAEGSQST